MALEDLKEKSLEYINSNINTKWSTTVDQVIKQCIQNGISAKLVIPIELET